MKIKTYLIQKFRESFSYLILNKLEKRTDINVFSNAIALSFLAGIFLKFELKTLIKIFQILNLCLLVVLLSNLITYFFEEPSSYGSFIRLVLALTTALFVKRNIIIIVNESWTKKYLNNSLL